MPRTVSLKSWFIAIAVLATLLHLGQLVHEIRSTRHEFQKVRMAIQQAFGVPYEQ